VTDESRQFLVFSGSNDRAVIAFLRAANRCRAKVSVVAMSTDDIVHKSAYAHQVVMTRDSKSLTIELFTRWVTAVREIVGGCELVIFPSSEYLNTFLLRNRAAIEGLGCLVPLVEEDIYRLVTNKSTSGSLFARHGAIRPREIPSSDVKPPVVAKPRANIDLSGRALYPHLIFNKTDLERFHAAESASEFFFQEWVGGPSFYLLLYLPPCGAPPLSTSQENLVQQPGGKSMLFARQASIHESPVLASSLAALRDIRFHGLCMIEFISRSGQMYFIELNPRPWGPIQFCEDLGVPMLEAFIADWTGKPRPTSRARTGRTYYAWFGGLVDTVLSKGRLATHGGAKINVKLIGLALKNDIYLRRDTWRCFVHELWTAISRPFHD
jgi:hypothetical protein